LRIDDDDVAELLDHKSSHVGHRHKCQLN